MTPPAPSRRSAPGSDSAADLAASLGDNIEVFRPRFGNLVAGIILGLAMTIGGILLARWIALTPSRKPDDVGERIAGIALVIALGVLLPTGGMALLVWIKRLITHRVIIGENGFIYVYRGIADYCSWAGVKVIRELFTHESLPILKIPGAAIHNLDQSFVLQRKADGKTFRFTVNTIHDLPRLADYFRGASMRFAIPWVRVER